MAPVGGGDYGLRDGSMRGLSTKRDSEPEIQSRDRKGTGCSACPNRPAQENKAETSSAGRRPHPAALGLAGAMTSNGGSGPTVGRSGFNPANRTAPPLRVPKSECRTSVGPTNENKRRTTFLKPAQIRSNPLTPLQSASTLPRPAEISRQTSRPGRASSQLAASAQMPTRQVWRF